MLKSDIIIAYSVFQDVINDMPLKNEGVFFKEKFYTAVPDKHGSEPHTDVLLALVSVFFPHIYYRCTCLLRKMHYKISPVISKNKYWIIHIDASINRKIDFSFSFYPAPINICNASSLPPSSLALHPLESVCLCLWLCTS